MGEEAGEEEYRVGFRAPSHLTPFSPSCRQEQEVAYGTIADAVTAGGVHGDSAGGVHGDSSRPKPSICYHKPAGPWNPGPLAFSLTGHLQGLCDIPLRAGGPAGPRPGVDSTGHD